MRLRLGLPLVVEFPAPAVGPGDTVVGFVLVPGPVVTVGFVLPPVYPVVGLLVVSPRVRRFEKFGVAVVPVYPVPIVVIVPGPY